MRFASADAALKAYVRLLSRTSAVPAMDIEGMQGYAYGRSCPSPTCKSKKFHVKREGKVQAPVCAHCGEIWKVELVSLPRGIFSYSRSYDRATSALVDRATLGTIFAAYERRHPWFYRALWLYVIDGLSYPAVIQALRRIKRCPRVGPRTVRAWISTARRQLEWRLRHRDLME